jgi:NitT/TauT family transport system permease protein
VAPGHILTPGRVRFALALALVLLLEALCRFGVIDRFAMIAPSEMLWDLGKILIGGQMWPAIAKTLSNVAVACAAAIVVGVILGTLIHAWHALRETLDPLFAAYYAIPVYAFYPLFIVLFGLGDVPQVLIGFMLGLVAVIVNTLNGLDRVPRALIKTARIHRLGPAATALRISLPYAMPYVFTGVKLAVAYSFIGVIGAELIMSRTGLGYEIGFAYNNFDNAVMYPLILLVLAIAASVNTMFFLWEKKLLARRSK